MLKRSSIVRSVARPVGLILVLFAALLSTVLTGCGTLAQQPPTEAVRLAVIQQLTRNQQTIAQALRTTGTAADIAPDTTPGTALGTASGTTPLKPNFKLDRLSIDSRKKISEKRFQQERYPTDIYKVQGTLETTLTAPGRKIHQSSPFEVYLGTNPPAKPTANSTPKIKNRKSGPVSDPASESASEPAIETWYLIDPDEPTQPQ